MFNGFRVVLFKEKTDVTKDVTENFTENVTENVTDNRHILMLRQIKNDNKITIDQLAKLFEVTRRTIIRDIDKLKEDGVIKRIGPDKGGHWQVLDK